MEGENKDDSVILEREELPIEIGNIGVMTSTVFPDEKVGLVPEEVDTGVTIDVKNPTLINEGVMSKTYIIYDVEGSDKNGTFCVKRRYRDFYELRARLAENWPGLLVPPLPEKKIGGNTDSEFVLERKGLLDYFMKRCSKLDYIFYSDEMQTFVRLSDEQFKKEFSIKRAVNPITILQKYTEVFPEEASQLTKDETIESVEKYFDKLKHTVEFYQNFLKVGRWYSKLKKKNTLDFLAFIKLSVADYKRKIPSADQEIALEKYNDFLEDCTQDELRDFIQTIKELSLEFQALLDLKNSLKFVIKVTEDNRRKQTEVNKEISKVKLTEGDQVKKGMFGGKMSKEERIKDLEDQLKESTEFLDAWMKIRGIIYNILNFKEFPKIVSIKNNSLSRIVNKYYENRVSIIRSELAMLNEIESHYKQYCTKQ